MDKKLLNRLNENPHQLSILIIIFFFFEIFANNIFSARIMEKLKRIPNISTVERFSG